MFLRFGVRRLIVLALAGLACGRDASTPDTGDTAAHRDPDPIVIRVPRDGGIARAAVYPALDSIIWEAGNYPALNRVLAFDPDAGLIAVTVRGGRPAHLDLRLGRSIIASRDSLRSPSSANGSDIFGIDGSGHVVRFSPAGSWSFTPPSRAGEVYPQPGGALLILSASGERRTLWRIFPPDDQILDSTSLPAVHSAVTTPTGDRLYFMTDSEVIPVQARTLDQAGTLRMRESVVAAVASPSGDRVYLAREGSTRIAVINRFDEGRTLEIELPGVPTGLRMDPLGRYLLARTDGDSVWVVGIAASRLMRTIPSRWAADLPWVAPDGAIATLEARDVVFLDPRTGAETLRATGGASEFWAFFHWNGFRPRPEGLDVPVTFPTPEPVSESLDAERQAAAGRAGAHPSGEQPLPESIGFTVSFATLLSQQRAAALADSINVGGALGRVVRGEAAGVPIFRVVIGPYPSRADAEAAGRASGRQFWIFEGSP
jgi:hypothetical protein